jgi:hypothetical protein
MMQQPVLLSLKFGAKSLHILRFSSMRNWPFGLPGWILCEQSPWCQRKWWACSWLCPSPVSPFSVSVSLDWLATVDEDTPVKFWPCYVLKEIQSLKVGKACGFDGITNECLQHPPRRPLVHLTRLSSAFAFGLVITAKTQQRPKIYVRSASCPLRANVWEADFQNNPKTHWGKNSQSAHWGKKLTECKSIWLSSISHFNVWGWWIMLP